MKSLITGKLTRIYLAFFIFLGFFLSNQAGAKEFQIYGHRALGMGGAGVAAVRDVTAIYWNPAVQGFFKKDMEDAALEKEYSQKGGAFNIQAGVQQFESFGDLYTRLDGIPIDEIMDDPLGYVFDGSNGLYLPNWDHVYDFVETYSVLEDFQADNPGINISISSGIMGNYGNFGIGVIGLGSVSSTIAPELQNVGPFDSPAAGTFAKSLIVDPVNHPAPGTTSYFDAAEINEMTQTIVNDPDPLNTWTPSEAQAYLDLADYYLDLNGTTLSRENLKKAIILFAQKMEHGSISDNTSAIVGQGAIIGEIPLSYGYAINEYLSVGANLKFMYAQTYSTRITVDNIEDDDYSSDVIDNKDTAYNFGLDIGLYGRWKKLRAGLLARNLNAPSFDFPALKGDPEEIDKEMKKSFRVEPQIRMGLAYLPFDSLVIAADFDLTNNKTFFGHLPNGGHQSSQNMSLGLEWTPIKVLSLRAGCYRNMHDDSIPIVLTAGLGLNLWAFHMDIGAAAATSQDKIEDVSYPTAAQVGLSFSLLF